MKIRTNIKAGEESTPPNPNDTVDTTTGTTLDEKGIRVPKVDTLPIRQNVPA